MATTKNKYTPKRVNIIIDELSNLSSKVKAAEAAGIAYKTYKEWYLTIPEFREKIDLVLEQTSSRIKAEAVEAVVKSFSTDYKAACWWLERTCPEEYGRREQINQNMTIQQVQIKYIQPEELPSSDETINLTEGTITLKIDDKQNDT